MSKKIEEIENALNPIVQSCGCDLIEVDYSKEVDGMTLTVFIHKEGGVTIDDCERVHNAIDAKTEEFDISNDEPYNLSVSSFGLTRQLRNTKELRYRINNDVEIKLFIPKDGKKSFVGNLVEVNDDDIALDVEGSHIVIDRKNIASAKLYLDF